MSAVERVFDSVDLRHEILKHVMKDKMEVHNMFKKMLGGQIIKRWKHYCNCNTCKAWRSRYA